MVKFGPVFTASEKSNPTYKNKDENLIHNTHVYTCTTYKEETHITGIIQFYYQSFFAYISLPNKCFRNKNMKIF